ncbi:MAG TPA: APC family permease [Polyangiaceae bacterium]|nr:APC family permease [Polyangiaceae bacterium]
MSITARVRRAVFGAPKDVKDPHAFHKLSLVALLAWVGLGADGLSSSAYGPDEAFRALGEHTGFAVLLALATALTVFIISYGYSRIIEQFPSGGGGYLVASKLLGPRVGVLSGAALLVDYVLTITISIASGADAIFSFLPPSWQPAKLPVAFVGVGLLTIMNLRGVKESVTTIAPVFAIFVVMHAILLIVVIGGHAGAVPRVAAEVTRSMHHSAGVLGTMGALGLFVRAYSLGGGTYTGIEAVSNGVAMMREPRVATARRTMVLMASSLAITAGGILLAYLLVHARPVEGKTMNAVLFEAVAGGWTLFGVPVGKAFIIVALLSEGGLLFVAAQAGFLDGPRVMANMATDSWLPHRFSALSERLTMRNGVMLMGGAAFAALIYTGGDVSKLVVMYSINVFLTFSLSNIGMSRFWVRKCKEDPTWARHLPAHLVAAALCLTILGITIFEKFTEGGWITLLITALLAAACFAIRRHYDLVVRAIRRLDRELPGPEESVEMTRVYGHEALPASLGAPDDKQPVAIVFVGGYGGLGRHAMLTLLRMFPDHFKGVVFVSIAVVDSDSFKGATEIEALEKRTQQSLSHYEQFAAVLGLKSTSAYAVGTEVAVEAERLATDLVRRFPKGLVVAGQIIFEEDTAYNRLLHNETAFLIQRRLQHAGVPMIVLPVQLDLRATRENLPPGKRRSAPEPVSVRAPAA